MHFCIVTFFIVNFPTHDEMDMFGYCIIFHRIIRSNVIAVIWEVSAFQFFTLTYLSSLKSRLIRVIPALTESKISYLRDITFNVNYSVNVSQQLQLHWMICNHLTTDTCHLTPAKISLTRPVGFDFKDNFTLTFPNICNDNIWLIFSNESFIEKTVTNLLLCHGHERIL